MKKFESIITWMIVLILLVAAGVYLMDHFSDSKEPPFRSVTVGNEYTATSTESGSGAVESKQLASGWGSVGSVVVTKAGDAVFQLLDLATTTLDTYDGYAATSSVLLAEFPTTLVAGTYTFDMIYNSGLYLNVVSGNTGTTTITYR